ncbi:MAG: hypothetical protein LC679_19580 [Intrasporangiaceae bacterium]|nr:hypothetical protein [Intrasporangiaceae bacterium]
MVHTDVQVAFGSMTDEERQGLSASLRAERGAANPEMDIPFAAPDSWSIRGPCPCATRRRT